MERLILASGSPRRRELLDRLGVACEIVPADLDESVSDGERAVEYAARISMEKVRAVHDLHPGRLVLAADTVVAVDGEVLGKPHSESESRQMLRRLSGRAHQVHTAVALADGDREAAVLDTAEVTFVRLAESTIRWYVATGEPADKAGAYAVQGAGGLLVKALNGSPHTVIGLPIHRLPELFSKLGRDFLALLDSDVARRSRLADHGIPKV